MKNKTGIKIRTSESKEIDKCISETDYINIMIINNIDENKIFTVFSLTKLINSLKEEDFNNIVISFHYICNSSQLFNRLDGKEYLGVIFHILLFILETQNEQLKNQKKLFFDDIILLINKLFLSKKLSDKDILLLLKFISFTSIHDRKDINQQDIHLLMNLSNHQIKNYKRFEYAFDIIKGINDPKITYNYCQFLQKNIFKNRDNYFLFAQKADLLNFLFLNDEDNKIMSFLSEIYSFKYNRHFLNKFMNEIKEVYDIKNKNKNSIEVLNKLNKTILFISELKKLEDNKYDKDPNMLPKCFVFNNNKHNGIYVNNIQIQSNFTIIFSFCFSPIKTQKNKKDLREFPIFCLTENGKNEKNYLNFFIKEGVLYFKHFVNEKKIQLCNIMENHTYLCYYGVKEKDTYIQISNKDHYLFNKKFQYQFKKNILLQIGKCNQQNFEGFMGTVLIFRKFLDDIDKTFFLLKGLYDRVIFFKDFQTNAIDIYDKIPNYNPEKYMELKTIIQRKDDLSKFLMYYITPNEEGQSLNKLYYYNTSFVETKISFYKEPKIENGATYFLYNKYSIFEFIKYEGLNYIVLILELITTNIENINEDKDKEIILNTFKNIIYFLVKIFESINIEFYVNETRNILFSIQKSVITICQKYKMDKEIIESLKYLILFLTLQNPEKHNKKNIYFIYIRNEICKFLLNSHLYDLNNLYVTECILFALNTSLIKNSYGLTSIDIFKNLMNFTVIYKQNILPEKTEIIHSKEFKSIKRELNNALINYLSKCNIIQPFIEIFQLFSQKYEFDYKNYQLFKIFYLCSEYFLGNDENKNIITNIKYFIELYNHLEDIDFNILNETQQKQTYIIMALCLRIFLEYNIKESLPNKNEKKIKVNVIIKNNNKTETNNNLSKSLMIPEKNKLNDEKQPELKDIIMNKNDNDNIIMPLNNNNYTTNYTSNISNVSDSTNNFKTNNTDTSINEQNNTNNNESENDNMLEKLKSTDEIIDKDENETLISKITEKYKFSDYFSFQTIFQNLFTCKKFSDYSFKSILLFILEKNNGITIPQKLKYQFIIKTKKYEDLKGKDYEQFLKISYYNEETKSQFIQLLNLLEKNNQNLTKITYDILIYLFLNIAKERQNRCVFRHFFASRKICGKFFLLIFMNNKESSETLNKMFQEMLELILPFHKKPFIYSFIFSLMTKDDLVEFGKELINIVLKINFTKDKNLIFYYLYKINTVILLYRILKSKNIIIDEKFNLNIDLQKLFNIDLATSKCNILKDISSNRKKTYIELLF